MTTKKRLLLISALPLVIVVTVSVLAILPAILPPRSGVTKATFDRIEKGMTLAEVEQVFGGKAILSLGPAVIWDADNGSQVMIDFVDDCVSSKRWYASNETILDKLRRWLRLESK